jgi:hypothetical protein
MLKYLTLPLISPSHTRGEETRQSQDTTHSHIPSNGLCTNSIQLSCTAFRAFETDEHRQGAPCPAAYIDSRGFASDYESCVSDAEAKR